MTIVRSPKTHNFSIISNTVLDDERLSWRAKGIAAYLLTKPDNWRINSTHLCNKGREGRDAVRAALKELEDAGYLVRTREQDEKGKWRTVSVMYEEPQSSPKPENPTPGNPYVGESGVLINTEYQVLNTSSHPSDEAEQGSRKKGSKQRVHDEWVDAIVPVLYQTTTFAALNKTHWSHVHGVRKKLIEIHATPADLAAWYKDVWRKGWPGTTRPPRPSEVGVGVAAYLERKAQSPAAKPQLVAVEAERS